MQPLLVVNVVGLTPRHLGPLTPGISAFSARGAMRPLRTVSPAVTCPVQSTLLTGLLPSEHGIVGNGWYFRDHAEVMFWRQSNRLVAGEKVWEAAKRRDRKFTCANLFWWYNMAASHDIGATPRPIYKADGRKLPDCYTTPPEWRNQLTQRLGEFPLFHFWGPATSIASSRWIADCAKIAITDRNPTLTLVYLPHLDYDLQRFGPDESHPAVRKSLVEIDTVVTDLVEHAQAAGRRVMILSEYGITAVDRPIHINRHLRDAGFLAVRKEDGCELLDPIASKAFAVADHQLAHIYVGQPQWVEPVRQLLASIAGVEAVWDAAGKRAAGLDHARAGELVAVADTRSWFTYYHWLDDAAAPDFARTVEIHRKPGYDPVELFLDPAIGNPKLAIGLRLAKRKLGFRALMDVIPLDASLVRGSHGRPTDDARDGPLMIVDRPDSFADAGVIPATDVKKIMLDTLFAGATP